MSVFEQNWWNSKIRPVICSAHISLVSHQSALFECTKMGLYPSCMVFQTQEHYRATMGNYCINFTRYSISLSCIRWPDSDSLVLLCIGYKYPICFQRKALMCIWYLHRTIISRQLWSHYACSPVHGVYRLSQFTSLLWQLNPGIQLDVPPL